MKETSKERFHAIARRGGLMLSAFLFFYAPQIKAQQFELVCPVGSYSVGALQSFDNSTGKYRQNYCIDANGNVTSNQGAGAPPNSPQPPSQQQGPAYNVRNYGTNADGSVGAKGDAKSSRNCTTTITGSGITSTDNPWVSTDVGRKLQAVGNSVSSFGAPGGGNPNNEVTISAFFSAGSISVGPSTATQSATGTCVWYTQQDNANILAAYTAADVGNAKGWEPGYGPATLTRPGQVFMPKGGYAVGGTIYNDINHNVANNNVEGVSLAGEPGTDIYVLPSFVPPNASASVGTLILAYLNQRAEFAHFSINGMGFLNTNLNPNQYLFGTLSSGRTWVHDININDWGTNQSTNAAFALNTTASLNRIDNLLVQNSPSGDQSTACLFNGAGVDIHSTFCSNHFTNWLIINSGQRTPTAPHFVIDGAQGDECGQAAGTGCAQLQNSTVNCIGCEFLNPGGGTPSWSLDTTSKLYLTDSYASSFNTDSGNSCSIQLNGNAQVFATASNFAGNNASAAICGPSTSKYFDLGGNLLFNQVAGVLTPCTTANIFTCGFSGGITPTFPLASGSTTQLGGRQIVASGTGAGSPTFAVTGFGTGPTITLQTGSTDAAGVAIITAGTTPGSSGTFTLTFSTAAGAYGINPPACIFGLQNGTGSWNALAQEPTIQTPTTTSVLANWADNSIALTAGNTYGFVWSCYGK